MGYIGHSRSERSQEAIDNGLLVYSQLSAWQKRAVDSGAVKPCEWHHTGKYFNKTNYFDPQDFEGLNPKDFPNVPKQKPIPSEHWYVLVSADWGGTSKHPRIVGADVQVTDKITDRQKNANKYSRYGGYIKEFDNEDDAKAFAKTAKLESMKRRNSVMRRTHRYNEGLGTNFGDYEYDEDATWYAPVITDVNEIIVLIKQGKFYGGNARKGLCFTIQAHGSRTVRNLGGRRWHEDKNSSKSWGRIWFDGHMIFSEDATLNVVRSHMVAFLRDVFDKTQPLRTETTTTRELDESFDKSSKPYTIEYEDDWGDKYRLFFVRSEYANNGKDAIFAYCYEYEDGKLNNYPEPYCDISVNLSSVPEKNCIWIDINNSPRSLISMLVKEGAIKYTGRTEQSGWVKYPEAEVASWFKQGMMSEDDDLTECDHKKKVEYKGHTIVQESKENWSMKLGNSDFSYKSLNEAKSAVDDLIKEGLFESLITTRM